MSSHPLETFLQEYLESADGLWDEVEPQVYDLMLPSGGRLAGKLHLAPEETVRVAFDPDALPEHPAAQFMTLGTPLMDGLIEEAQRAGRFARAYVVGLNLRPHDLNRQIARAVDLPQDSEMRLCQTRGMNFTIAVFWFNATFVSDQKEQEKFPVAIELSQGRQARHLDKLLSPAHLSESPAELFPDAAQKGLAEAYALARDRAVRSVAAAANLRRRDLDERYCHQEARMMQYYQDLREEAAEQIARAQSRGADTERALSRSQSIDQEEKLRLAELRAKSALRVQLKLMNLLEIRQPKLLIETKLTPSGGEPAPLVLVWDPLAETFDAPSCPECSQPTFAFRFRPKCPTWLCRSCAARPLDHKTKRR